MRFTTQQLNRWLEEWLAQTTRTAATCETYRNGVRIFIESEIALDEYAIANFDHYLFNRRSAKYKRPYSRNTRNIYCNALDQFLLWLEAKGLIEVNRERAKNQLKITRGNKKHEPYTYRRPDPAVPKIIEYYESLPLPPAYHSPDETRLRLELLRNRALVHTLLATGARVTEVITLTRRQVADGSLPEVHIVSAKSGENDVLFLTPEAQAAIAAYCAERTDSYEHLFISHRRGTGQALSRRSVLSVVKNAAKALGLSANTSPHSFRHWLAEDMVNNGVPLEAIQKVLRHQDINTTERIYARRNLTTIRAEINAYRERKKAK